MKLLRRPTRAATWRASRFASTARSMDGTESTFESLRWQRARSAQLRWSIWGGLCGATAAAIIFAPAAWLSGWVEQSSRGHLLLADARGSVWNGSAVAVLTGGAGSRDARALPGRLQWRLRPGLEQRGPVMHLSLRHACCLNGEPTLSVQPGLGTVSVQLRGEPGGVGQWPAGWLTGLGTPWNTLQLGGVLRLSSPGIRVEGAQGRWRVDGAAALEVVDAASRVSTLSRLGSYRLDLGSEPGNPGAAGLRLSTIDGSLQLSGAGTLGANGLRFRGEATASEQDRPALVNLLNIIGRRDGARSVIAIG